MGGDPMNRPAQGMADRPAAVLPARTPMQQLAADVHELAGNLMVPVTVRNTLRLAVLVLTDQEQRIKALEGARHG